MTENTIQERAMLTQLSISVWTARKYDAGATADACKANQASGSAGRFNKALLPKAALAGIQAKAGEIRNRHYDLTLPWNDAGARLLPVDLHERYQDAIMPLIDQFDRLVDAFLPQYESFRRMAKNELGNMYNEADYPVNVKGKFAVALEFYPVPASDHFYAKLSDSHATAIKAQITKSVEARIQATVTECWDRLKGQLAKIAERLGNDDAIFRDSLTLNMAEILDTLPSLNVMGDAALNRSIMETRKLFQRNGRFVSADQLRNDKGLRKQVATETAKILADLEGLAA